VKALTQSCCSSARRPDWTQNASTPMSFEAARISRISGLNGSAAVVAAGVTAGRIGCAAGDAAAVAVDGVAAATRGRVGEFDAGFDTVAEAGAAAGPTVANGVEITAGAIAARVVAAAEVAAAGADIGGGEAV